MITEWVMNAFVGALHGVLSLMPDFDGEEIEESFDWESAHGLFEPVLHANGWIPIYSMLIAGGLLAFLRLNVFLYSYYHHLWKSLPFT